jgi:phospholipid/cholesterol/gamma-HCH transport system substrate-binding protein
MTKEFRLGAFLLLTLGCFALAVFLVGDRSAMFHSSYRLNTQFDNVGGLEEGAAVRVGGIREGMVKHLILPKQPDGKVTVVMDLEKSTQEVVKKDSVAAIQSDGLLGDKFVEVTFGSDDAPNLKNGDTIASQPPIEISSLIAKTDKILDTASGAVDNIKSLTGNFDSISAKINQGKGTVGALVNDKTIYTQATTATAALSDDAEAIKHNFLLRGFFKNRGFEDSGDLTKYEIARIPAAAPAKSFAFDSKKLFDDADKSKLKNGKALTETGQFLQDQPFGLAVIAASTGMKGDSQKDKLLTEAQALVVREYLVKNFKLDDTHLKTIGLGKSSNTEDVNRVEIRVYPPGTALPEGTRATTTPAQRAAKQ